MLRSLQACMNTDTRVCFLHVCALVYMHLCRRSYPDTRWIVQASVDSKTCSIASKGITGSLL